MTGNLTEDQIYNIAEQAGGVYITHAELLKLYTEIKASVVLNQAVKDVVSPALNEVFNEAKYVFDRVEATTEKYNRHFNKGKNNG
ncbi:hypothetical protein EKK58_07295 [Candidatus Dependentiae bacterium]|nr:MAG: hypothetical protein EKK58_07295 [Candidatus Dependentiae bacterium]